MGNQPSIIFDLDGTLADTLSDLVSALNRSLAVRDINSVHPDKIGYMTGKGGLKAMVEYAFEMDGVPLGQELLDEVFAASIEDYRQNIMIETVLYPGVRASLEHFSKQGWLLGVCTNKPIALAEKLLRRLDIDQLFTKTTGADSFDFKKPDPRHLIRTIELAGGQCSKAIMVGDTINDIVTAQNANIPVIAVDFGYSEHPVQTYGPDRVISSYDTLFDEADRLIGSLAS